MLWGLKLREAKRLLWGLKCQFQRYEALSFERPRACDEALSYILGGKEVQLKIRRKKQRMLQEADDEALSYWYVRP
jgi:hypothetical protein